MDTPVKFILGILVITVTAAVAFGGVSKTGKAQGNIINKTEDKASSLLD